MPMYNSALAHKNINTLIEHADKNEFILTQLFAQEANRAELFTLNYDNISLDYSKNLISQTTLKVFEQALNNCNLKENITNMLKGDSINTSEQRSALHIALRSKHDLIPKYISTKVADCLSSMEEFALSIKPNITDIIHIGIGGSDLGPKMVYDSLKAGYAKKLKAYFVSNVDASYLDSVLDKLNPDNTLILVCSKTFSTIESLQNFSICQQWLGENNLTNVVAITSASNLAKNLGINQIFDFPDWVGGRFSVWGTVGLVIILCYGIQIFKQFLAGAENMDNHFIHKDFNQNMPQILAMLGIWYRNVFNISSYCIAPYAANLAEFPGYLQQLEMESNGKSIGIDNKRLSYHTAPVIFGEVGSNCQHAFFQLLHQGTQWMPIDFISYKTPHHKYIHQHNLLLKNCFAQSKALMYGELSDRPYLNNIGNRPSNTILLNDLSAYSIGNLLALYEHKVYTQGVFWHINSFDQWGVEFGKKLALNLENYEDCII